MSAGFMQQFAGVCNPNRSETNMAAVLKELSGGQTPSRVICCGHSLGGALATLGLPLFITAVRYLSQPPVSLLQAKPHLHLCCAVLCCATASGGLNQTHAIASPAFNSVPIIELCLG